MHMLLKCLFQLREFAFPFERTLRLDFLERQGARVVVRYKVGRPLVTTDVEDEVSEPIDGDERSWVKTELSEGQNNVTESKLSPPSQVSFIRSSTGDWSAVYLVIDGVFHVPPHIRLPFVSSLQIFEQMSKCAKSATTALKKHFSKNPFLDFSIEHV
ncbi:unnamed protein product [Angiostrongylus costaricensis]|uniref:Mediator of RNA polymerase II transcription subunit 20 n=1 Tax=Angiostrongylus costaricensis TaxID=334426 RepID=A0A0R3PIM5_ANGCS|nr:unnamed protein product [Angiostrongylus costaricensis]